MTSFRVVLLMYRPLWSFNNQYLTLFVCVQTFHLDYYTSCGVDNVHKKFQGCTVDVQAATVFLTIST